MEGERLIRELLSVKKKFENKPVLTFETNIPMMIYDVVNELNKLNAEIESNKHYIELGKAIEKAFDEGYTLMKVSDTDVVDVRYEDTIEIEVYKEINDLLTWKEGKNHD